MESEQRRSPDDDSETLPLSPSSGAAFGDARGRAEVYRGRRDDVVGGYRLLKKIGGGGMGDVWDARHERHGGRAAVKIILRQAYDEDDDAELAREFAVLVHMRHDHIVRVWDAGIHDDGRGRRAPYVIMDYIADAQPITRYAAERRLDVRERLRLFREVCDGVAYVHENGEIHLDIKPDNLLVDAEGRVFLTDFGLARPVLGWFVDRVAGTPAFMGPEQLAGMTERIDRRADVWSLGAVLYHLLADADPYGLRPDAPPQARVQAVRDQPRSLSAATPELHDQAPELLRTLETIVSRSMAVAPGDRYANAAELGAALDAALDVRGVRGLRGKRPVIWSAVVLTAFVILATTIGTLTATPLMTLWPGPVAWFGRWLPAPHRSVAELDRLPDVAIIGFDTATAASLREAPGLEDFEPNASRSSFRPMHSAIIPRLAAAGAKVIVLDLFFPRPTEHDEELAAAIEAAQAAGTPVVIGVNSWRLEDGRPSMSPALWAAAPEWGGLTVGAALDESNFWAHLLVERPNIKALPSLSLAAYAAYRSPGARHDFEVIDGAIRVRQFTSAGRDVVGTFTDEWVEPSFDAVYRPDGQPSDGLEPGDHEWCLVLALPDSVAFERSSMRYEDVWNAAPGLLAQRLSERVVFVRDLERDNTVGGTKIMGGLVHAAAIQSLILQRPARVETGWNVPLAAGAAGIAALTATGLRRRCSGIVARRRRVARTGILAAISVGGIAAAVISILAIAWVVRFVAGAMMYPVPGVIAAVVAAGVACTGRFDHALAAGRSRRAASTTRSLDS